jgi:hypothetical protein
LKKNTRLPFLLLIAVLWIITLVRAQEIATSRFTPVASTYEAGELLQKYGEISALPMSDRRNFFRNCSARDKSNLWRVHLALQLVKRPELNGGQVRIILDAISLSSSEFFAATNGTPTEKTKADDALQSLTRRALGAFRKNEAAEVFANMGGGKAEDDILQKYYDISALPLKKRRASFRNASSNDKSDLWRTHLALFLVKRPDLNEWQKEIILVAMSLATPELFEVRPTNPGWKAKVGEPLRSLQEHIVVAFSLEDGAKIFATLGDNTESAKGSPNQAGSILLNTINYKQPNDTSPYKLWTHSRFAGQDVQLEGGNCQCSMESDWCPMGGACSGTGCSPTSSGCGTLWGYPCNGASCR